jgi:5-methylcytosine-specific restriction endonuclease McrA
VTLELRRISELTNVKAERVYSSSPHAIAERRYRAAHLVEVRTGERERYRAYSSERRTKINARRRELHAAHPERRRAVGLESARRYRVRHGAECRERSIAKIYVLRGGKPELISLTAAEWQWLVTYYGGACAYCGRPFTKKIEPVRDHLITIRDGGSHSLQNIVPSCQSCNIAKKRGNLSPFFLDSTGQAHFGLIHTSCHLEIKSRRCISEEGNRHGGHLCISSRVAAGFDLGDSGSVSGGRHGGTAIPSINSAAGLPRSFPQSIAALSKTRESKFGASRQQSQREDGEVWQP